VTSSELAARPRRLTALVAAGVLGAVAVVTVRVAVDSRAALHGGWVAEGRGETLEAIRRYLDAARLTLPASPWVREALDRLDRLATHAEQEHDSITARRALEAMRAAILGSRSFYTPHGGRSLNTPLGGLGPPLDARLARLYAAAEAPEVAPAATREAREAWHAARLARRPGPSLPFAVLALVGLGLWVLAALAFVRRGLDAGLRPRRGPAITAGVLFALGLTLFVVGLRLA
jgi:hypothetical protein